MNENDNAGKIQLGINIARELEEGHEAGNGQNNGEEKQGAAVLAACADKVHGFT